MSMVPTVYFIDDSATMREVIKIAFRRENINVLTSHDAVLALEEIEKNRPDIVITDVIMPVKDGYEVCQFIKTHPDLANIPVVLMSGVVNRAVAERAFAVKANELLRKPFQPQDLISRVRHLLMTKGVSRTSPAAAANASAALSSIFSTTAPMAPRSIAAAAKSRPWRFRQARPLQCWSLHFQRRCRRRPCLWLRRFQWWCLMWIRCWKCRTRLLSRRSRCQQQEIPSLRSLQPRNPLLPRRPRRLTGAP